MMNVNWNHATAERGRDGQASMAVVATDPLFHQLGEFHQEALLLSHIGQAIRDLGVPERCEILNVWYIFKKRFQVVYRVRGGQDTGEDAILLVEFLPRGTSPRRFQEAIAGARNRKAVVHLPAWDAIARIFPEDPGLPWLSAMIDRQTMASRMSRHLTHSLDGILLSWDLMSYLPGQRCAVRYELGSPPWALFAKMQRGDSTGRAHRRMVRLWESPHRRFRMPRPLGYHEGLGLRWESFASGRRIEDLLPRVDLDAFLARIVRDLVSLHGMRLQDLAPNGLEQVIHRLEQKVLPRIRETLSPVASSLDAFHTTLMQKAGSLPERRAMTIHGDFHTANVLVDDEGATFTDLDSLACGDPAYDLALLGSRLLLIALHRGERVREITGAVADLPMAYEAASGHRIPARTFAWYMAALLVGRQIKTCVRHRAPACGQLATALLALAHETLRRERFDASTVSGCGDLCQAATPAMTPTGAAAVGRVMDMGEA